MGAAWRTLRNRLRAVGIVSAELDARLLAELAFGFGGIELIRREGEPATLDALERLEVLGDRRAAHEPVARIIGHREFYGLDFSLSAATLEPRPETELLVDLVLRHMPPDRPARVLDLGTGTGCISIAVLVHLRKAHALATDLSPDALKTARRNARRHGVVDRWAGRAGDWFAPVAGGERFDMIVSNPPYIESGAIPGLMQEVREHDPMLALDGGADGLAAYRRIALGARGHLNPGGAVAVEIGAGQAAAVAAIFTDAGFVRISVERDLAGLDRAIVSHDVT